jgi:hypothetical protein
MPIAMIEAFIGQPAKHNCLVLIITRLRQNKNDVICPVADDDFHGSSKRADAITPGSLAINSPQSAVGEGRVVRDARGRRGFGRVIDWRRHNANGAAPTPVNVTVGKRSREYLTDREVERLHRGRQAKPLWASRRHGYLGRRRNVSIRVHLGAPRAVVRSRIA